jgi:hypothetical protein
MAHVWAATGQQRRACQAASAVTLADLAPLAAAQITGTVVIQPVPPLAAKLGRFEPREPKRGLGNWSRSGKTSY